MHYMTRTQESVLLDDALADKVYSKDEYVRGKRSRSVLCLPIVNQAKLVGALYLENNLTPYAFTPDWVTVLQLLASQAAISLENAAFYIDLQLQVGLLQLLPVSAWQSGDFLMFAFRCSTAHWRTHFVIGAKAFGRSRSRINWPCQHDHPTTLHTLDLLRPPNAGVPLKHSSTE
jgi:hypothetical protein